METKFKQAIRLFGMAAVALLMTACSNDDYISGDQPAENGKGIPFTATISNGGSATRALSDPDGSNVITATWSIDEEVALVYKIGDDLHVTKAKVTAVSDGTDGKTTGTATITATLADGVTSGTDVTLIYPYSAVNLTAGDDYGKIKTNVFEGQTGELTPRATPDGTSISEKYDLRIGTGKISLATTPASLKENVTMASQIAIWKLTLQSGGSDLSATKLDVYFGGMTASATKAVGASEYYMAVPAGATGITFIASDGTDSYIFNRNTDVTLNASSYYQSTVTLTKQTTRAITTETGELTLNDGDIVTGTGGAYGAGIGSGDNNTATNTCGAITISGGNITAAGGGNAAGIGSGHANQATNTCGDITISGSAQVTANGADAAGIGSGRGNIISSNIFVSVCGAISITGGTVTATGGNNAAGIGSGWYGKFTSISIGSGITSVTATRSDDYYNVPIGKGRFDQGSGAVTFDGVTMHNGTNTYWWKSTDWTHWPEDGGPFGGILVTASNYGNDNGRTWTLTPAP